MSFILSTGSNLGDKSKNLFLAKQSLCAFFALEAEGDILETEPVDYLEQDLFLNQVLQFDSTGFTPTEVLSIIQKIENQLGRIRNIPKGPRTIDIDIIFWRTDKMTTNQLTIPHPAWNKRDFIYNAIKVLPYYSELKKSFTFPE